MVIYFGPTNPCRIVEWKNILQSQSFLATTKSKSFIYDPYIAPMMEGKSCNCSNFETKTLICDSLKYFSHTIFHDALLWTSYESSMFCNSPLLSNMCNDIATISCTDTITLNQKYILKYGPNFSHQNMNVMNFNRDCFLNSFSVYEYHN